jgi:hypothetical protein
MTPGLSRNGLHLLAPHQLQADFPILSRQVNGKRLAYLDSGRRPSGHAPSSMPSCTTRRSCIPTSTAAFIP